MMFADDRSIENLQQLFVEFKKYLKLQKEYTKLEITEKLSILAFRLGTTIGGYHFWHGGTVLFVICISLYIRPACRRTHGKLQHHRRFSPSARFISNHFPQETHHQSNGELHCRTVF